MVVRRRRSDSALRFSHVVALPVLTNHGLFQLMTAYQRGVPGHLTDFVQSLRNVASIPPLAMAVFGKWFESHSLYEFELFCTSCPNLLMPSVMDQVAAMGNLEALRHLHRLDVLCTNLSMNLAAKHGHLNIVKFLHAHRNEGCTASAMNWAAEFGHIEIVEFLQSNRREGCTKAAMTRAAKAGHLNVVKFLHFHRQEGGYRDMLHEAIAAGHVDVVEFITCNRPNEPCTRLAMDQAARNGHLNMVQYLHAHRTEGCSPQAIIDASAHGHYDVVAFLVAKKSKTSQIPDEALCNAASGGHLLIVELLQPLCSKKASRMAVEAAAKTKQLTILQFFHTECPRALERARRRAAIDGSTDMVELLGNMQLFM